MIHEMIHDKPNDTTPAKEWLQSSVTKRFRPEDVAQLIVEALMADGASVTPEIWNALNKVAAHSYKRNGWRWTSMAQEFGVSTKQFQNQLKAAQALLSAPFVTPEAVRDAIIALSPAVFGPLKLDKAGRRAAGIFKNARWVNKRRRLMRKIERKIAEAVRNEKRDRLRVISKTSLASQLPANELEHLPTLCFVAYMAARKGKRSLFTNKSQESAYDRIAETLLDICAQRPNETNWFAIGHVFPDVRVLEHLTPEDQGRLLVAYWRVLEDAGDVLEKAWTGMSCQRESMIVERGDDSSTWNEAAGAFNQARAAWLNLLYCLRMDKVMDAMLPGKVMRVMAGDVARWHRSSGGGVHPDTLVWALLPPPWEVLNSTTTCTRKEVESACRKANASLESWSVPRSGHRVAVEFTPTPELVHGVTVSSPGLAYALRQCGVFSGKGLKDTPPSHEVTRDEYGAAVLACAKDE